MDYLNDEKLYEYIITQPNRFFIDISSKGCGNDCAYCYVETKADPQQLLTLQQIQRICEMVSSECTNHYNIISLCPNTEPLKSPDSAMLTLFIAKYFASRNCFIQISTKELIPSFFLDELNSFANGRVFINISVPHIANANTFEPNAPAVEQRMNNFKLINKYSNICSCLYIKPFSNRVAENIEDYINAINSLGIETVCVGVSFTRKGRMPCQSLHNRDIAQELYEEQRTDIDSFVTLLRANTKAKVFSSSVCCICNKNRLKCLLNLHEFDPIICADCLCFR